MDSWRGVYPAGVTKSFENPSALFSENTKKISNVIKNKLKLSGGKASQILQLSKQMMKE